MGLHHRPDGKPHTDSGAEVSAAHAGDLTFAVTASQRIGCDLEKRAIAFYSEHAEKTDDPELKKLFTWLTKWEKAHLAQLLDLEKFYKDAFWADQGFMPM